MGVAWYYTVGGERKGPAAWSEVREAAAQGALAADSLVWTASFGSEWRKAATLSGLFPQEAATPAAGVADAEPAKEIERHEAELHEAEAAARAEQRRHARDSRLDSRDPAGFDFRGGESRGGVPFLRRVNVVESIADAWLGVKRLIFGAAPLRRWFLFALCLMLASLFTPRIPFPMAQAEDAPALAAIEHLGLAETFSTGIFDKDFVNRLLFAASASAAAPESAPSATPESAPESAAVEAPAVEAPAAQPVPASRAPAARVTTAEIGAAIHVTAIAVKEWATAPLARLVAPPVVFVVIISVAIWLWFFALGTVMFIARVFSPDAPLNNTFLASSKIAGSLFRGMFVFNIALLAAAAWLIGSIVWRIAAFPSGADVPPGLVDSLLMRVIFFATAQVWLNAFSSDFVAPRMAISGGSYAAAFVAALKSIRLWYAAYLLALAGFYTLLLIVLATASALFSSPALILIAAAAPTNAMLGLPIHLWRRLWTLEIIFRIHPEVRPRLFHAATHARDEAAGD